jgi:hypothetical protein
METLKFSGLRIRVREDLIGRLEYLSFMVVLEDQC